MNLTNKEIRAILAKENLTSEGRAVLDALLDEFVPNEDAMEIIKREVQDAIDNQWNKFIFEISETSRKIAAIKCLRALSKENRSVRKFFGINNPDCLGLAEAKKFVETNFKF